MKAHRGGCGMKQIQIFLANAKNSSSMYGIVFKEIRTLIDAIVSGSTINEIRSS